VLGKFDFERILEESVPKHAVSLDTVTRGLALRSMMTRTMGRPRWYHK